MPPASRKRRAALSVTALCLGSLACAAPAAASGEPLPDALLFHRLPLAGGGAACADGSSAAVYYRNCSANWDRKPGGPDLCGRALNPVVTWLLAFLPDAAALGPLPASRQAAAARAREGGGAMPWAAAPGGYCYDAASCASRAANLSGAAWQPERAWADGALSPFAEVNPNLYKQHSVLVPYCTSDLFAGTRGARVLAATLDAIFTSPAVSSHAADADRVVVIGGAGVLAHIDALAADLRARKAAAGSHSPLAVFGVCAGCLLPAALPAYPQRVGSPCTDDGNCPPASGLPALAAYAGLAHPAWCTEPPARTWACYTAEVLGPALAAAQTPVLVAQQLFDATLAAAAGVDTRAPVGADVAAWLQGALAPQLARAAAAASPYAVAAACALPSAPFADAAYYRQLVNRTDAYNNTRGDALGVALPSFLEAAAQGGAGKEGWGAYADCAAVGCNPTC